MDCRSKYDLQQFCQRVGLGMIILGSYQVCFCFWVDFKLNSFLVVNPILYSLHLRSKHHLTISDILSVGSIFESKSNFHLISWCLLRLKFVLKNRHIRFQESFRFTCYVDSCEMLSHFLFMGFDL